jgi:hypothetical protein
MKKLILAAFALTTAASVFAQGTIIFNIRLAANQVHVWGPSATLDSSISLIGLGSNDLPAGTTPFAADGMTLIGSSGINGRFGAATMYAQLIGINTATAALAPEASLVPVGQTTTFRTGGALGQIVSITDTLSATPPIAADSTFASFEIVAWDNSSGNYPTWSQASVAWRNVPIAAGHSAEFSVSAIGGLNPPPNLDDMSHLTSFNLYFFPEPSTLALAGLGAAVLMIARGRKKPDSTRL